ncbi:MAG TPA: hypothetical protein VLQ76_01365 [Bacteroidales bacterium]|nr:hypothetical protein [Bacteroidales bacterium]
MKLEEGKTFTFNALKTVELPGGEVNLMLAGPDGKKYLLPLTYYRSYNIVSPGIVQCKVDKINCSGKVFLEPVNPWYSEGESYGFEVRYISECTDSNGIGRRSITVSDRLGNLINVPAELAIGLPEEGEKISLKVERISKGKLYFTRRTEADDLERLEEGRSYDFRILKKVSGPDDEPCYAAADIYGDVHLLQVRYYSHYGFKVGASFRGKVVRYSSGSLKTVEPENPWFKPGDKMRITVVSCIPLETGEGFICDGFDDNGFNHTLTLSEVPAGNSLICRVIKIRKGKPVLEKAE